MSWGPEVYGRDAVLDALYSRFLSLAAEERQRQGKGPLPGASMPLQGLATEPELRQVLAGEHAYGLLPAWAAACTRVWAGRHVLDTHLLVPSWTLPPRPPAYSCTGAADQEPGDVLLALYERLMGVSADGMQATFGLPFSDHVRCHVCDAISRQSTYVRSFHTAQVGGWMGGGRIGRGGTALVVGVG